MRTRPGQTCELEYSRHDGCRQESLRDARVQPSMYMSDRPSRPDGCLGRRAHGVGHAILVRVNGLERMVADHVIALVTPIPSVAIAMALAHQSSIRRHRLNLQDLAEALVHEHVLAPLSEVHLGDASLRGLAIPAQLVVRREGVDGAGAEELDGAMHAIPAIVDVARTLVLDQELAQPVREKNSVRVDLDDPTMLLVVPDGDQLPPHLDEDPSVQCRHGVASVAALECAVDDLGDHRRGDRELLVAVDGRLVAAEDAGLVVVLPLQQALLVAFGHHQGEAVQRSGGLALARGRRREGLASGRLAGHQALERLLLGNPFHKPALARATR
mmetsp:Transcript_104479/g.271992  ORF Transcript_104479/g.271992 Transcript_104479/m.271992 type:complete len:328 (+) Transcript_104479:150-1133(+)